MTHVAIIGNGITGVTTARRLRELQPDWRITMISGESDFHYSRPALMYIFMGHMNYQDTKPYENHVWENERIDLVRDWVTAIDVEGSTLTLHQGGDLAYDKLLIATGSKSNRFDWPGQDLDGVQGLYDLMDLRRLYENVRGARRAVIVGGGLIGIELAEMLHARNLEVTFLVREASYWSNILPPEESAMINRAIRAEGFDLRLETELAEIIDNGSGRVRGVHTRDGETIECEIVGLTAGVSPNIDLVKDTTIETKRGVLVDWNLRTTVDNIFAAGDCAEIRRPDENRNLLQQVWYTGRMQGEIAAANLAGGDERYDPGVWYNSAKFLDIEYQTYGDAPARGKEGETQLWWEHPDGRSGVRLVYENDSGRFRGVNVMGVRWRHEVCEGWIRDERTIDEVLERLEDANFDAEFFARHEDDMRRAFRAQMNREQPA